MNQAMGLVHRNTKNRQIGEVYTQPVLNPTTGANWAARAVVLGGACVAITIAAHVVAGGTVPAVAVVFVSALMVIAAVWATTRELHFTSLLAFLVGAQVVSHLLLNGYSHSGGSTDGALALTSDRAGHAGHMAAERVVDMAALAAAAVNDHGLTAGMILAHGVACVLAALVLREGERVFFALHRALPNVLRALLGAFVTRLVLPRGIQTGPVFPIGNTPELAGRVDQIGSIVRRGPPLGLLLMPTATR